MQMWVVPDIVSLFLGARQENGKRMAIEDKPKNMEGKQKARLLPLSATGMVCLLTMFASGAWWQLFLFRDEYSSTEKVTAPVNGNIYLLWPRCYETLNKLREQKG